VKRPEVLRPLEDVTWDVAVLDEAHAAALGTDRRAAADAVAARARHVVLLTATPHGGDELQFEALCRLGGGVDAGALAAFRRSRADAGPVAARRTVLLTVAPSAAERRMHRLLERYARRIAREACDESRATLAAIVLRKRALSSAASLQASAARRQALLAGREPAAGIQLALPLGDEDPLPDDIVDETLAAPGLNDASREQRALTAIVRAARDASERETKIAFLLRLLRRVREPVIVFTEYRDTLTRLAAALEHAGHRPLQLHGGLLPGERNDVRRAFNAGGTVLVATDAASEGLNLHHCCRVVVHFELPWSPVRLQQRTGRVDRIGQERRVHEILLVAGDTAERLVLAPLARRVALAARHSASTARLFDSITESRVAAAVLSGAPLTWPEPAPASGDAGSDPGELRDGARAEVRRVLERRRWRERASSGRPPLRRSTGRPLAMVRRLGSAGPSLVLVWRVSLHDADGYGIHEELVPVALSGGESEEQAREHLRRRLDGRLERIASAHQAATASLDRRERAIADLIPAAARQIVQAGLFDRRALKASAIRGRATSALLAESGNRIEALGTARHLTKSFEVAAKLVIHRP
jgi:superfamily II DNA or RNA helicase